MPKKEGFSWAGSIKEMPGVDNLIRGQALHPLRTVHPEEWPEVREYIEEELEKSANTLVGVPLILDHCQVLNGKVLGAEYEDGAIEYVAQLNEPNVIELVRNGAIKHCSVEFEWKSLDQVNGVAPRGINFTGLSLLRMFQPGDPKTSVEVWEGIIKELKEAKAPPPTKPENKPTDEETKAEESDKEKQSPSLEARVTFLETSKLLKEQDNQEPETDEHCCLIGKERYNEELGKCVPVDAGIEKKSLGEAILGSESEGSEQETVLVILVEDVKARIPPLQAERSMDYGGQRFVQEMKGLIHEAKEVPAEWIRQK